MTRCMNGNAEGHFDIKYFSIESIQPCVECSRDVAYSYDVEAYVHVQEPEKGCGMNEGRDEVFRFINRNDQAEWDKWS